MGDYLAIITLAANYIIKSAIENIQTIGGARGFMGMSRVINGMESFLNWPWMMVWIGLFVFLTIQTIQRFVGSTYGRGILAIREDEIAAEIMGVNTRKVKMVAFMVSSGLAGIAGGLFAHILGYINPGSFTIMKSTEVMVMVYLGGNGFFERVGSECHSFYPDPGGIAALAGTQMGLGALSSFSVDAFPTGRVAGSRELTDVFPGLRRLFGQREKE